MIIDLDIDAPRDPEYTRQVAEAAAEAVRVLCHATLGVTSGALRYPSDADAVLRAMESMAARLPQLLAQLSRWLAAEREAARIRLDDGARPDAAVTDTRRQLKRAGYLAEELAGVLNGAAAVTSHMAAAGDDGDG